MSSIQSVEIFQRISAERVNDFETLWARIYCRPPGVRAGRLAAVASFSGVSR